MVLHRVLLLSAALASCCGAGAAAAGDAGPDPAAALRQALAEAEAAQRGNEPQIAESRYRSALLEGWLLTGALDMAARDLPAGRAALLRATESALETRRALTALALVHLQLGENTEAIAALRTVSARYKGDLATRRLLAQALVAAGQPEQAVQELEEVRAKSPGDSELAFTLASGYLRVGKLDQAARLFDEVYAARPAAQTLVLIGRTYRDFEQPERAAAAFAKALSMDPRVRRAHYYLGTLALLDEDGPRLEEAIVELQRELAVYPDDEAAQLYLGMALVESKRFAEAVSPLASQGRSEHAPIEALLYLGRCLLGLDRPVEAVEPLRRARSVAESQKAEGWQISKIEYQLALALRRTGREGEAAEHFAAAERFSAEQAQSSRDRLARYLSDAPEPDAVAPFALSTFMATSIDALTSDQRQELQREVQGSLARAYFNLAVIRLQAAEFARAAELLVTAAELDPELPGLHRALGVAYFNAGQHAAAIEPLARALAREPGDRELQRLLALSYLQAGEPAKAADLLAADPQRAGDPALQYAYALALVRGGRAGAAQEVFTELLRDHADWPELYVLLAQAYAGEADFEKAIDALHHALALSATVPEAQLTLGSIYLRQGRLPEAEQALRAELLHRPGDLQARYQLATVLELGGKQEEAITELGAVLEDSPNFANGRYLLGKMLLARGDAQRAATELAAAAELAPGDANIHYQLGQAYQKLGQTELARQQFDLYRELKRGERGGAS
jgi:predicted Zn-dependent protease